MPFLKKGFFDGFTLKPSFISNFLRFSNDVSSIGQSLKEIEAYEDFHRGTPEEDPEEDFETIRRQRKAI